MEGITRARGQCGEGRDSWMTATAVDSYSRACGHCGLEQEQQHFSDRIFSFFPSDFLGMMTMNSLKGQLLKFQGPKHRLRRKMKTRW